MVNSSETVNDISNLNLSYLLLAQRMFKEDPATAMYRLGMSRELADLLGKLTLAQIVKISASNLLLCRFRFDEHPMLSVLTSDSKTVALQQAHASIVLSSQHVAQPH